jgi:flagellar transcriptional activator FlhC
MTELLPLLLFVPPCGAPKNCIRCKVKPCRDATKIHDAVRLIQAGARATLVCQLTELPKKLVKRMYTLLQGHPSPRGQMPFTDAWFLENDLRMLHATLVWQLHKRIAREHRSEARVLLEVYTVYRCMVNKPQLNLTRTSVVLRLVAMALWQERQCGHCGNTFLAPTDEKHDVACPGCRLYHRYRCCRCGSAFEAQAMGRPRTVCSHCLDSKASKTNRSKGNRQ